MSDKKLTSPLAHIDLEVKGELMDGSSTPPVVSSFDNKYYHYDPVSMGRVSGDSSPNSSIDNSSGSGTDSKMPPKSGMFSSLTNNSSFRLAQPISQINSSAAPKNGEEEILPDIENPINDTSVVAIVSINGKGKILYSNRKAHKILECRHLTGKYIHDFVPKNFREKHVKLIESFFKRPYVGERLDPDTIIRAVLQSGKSIPLNLGLETKVDPVTQLPIMVFAFITEATSLIEQSKVEKMLSRATLVVIQQFVSQTVLSAVAFYEVMNIPKLRYGNAEDEETKLIKCKEYSFYKLGNGGAGGENDKMLYFVICAGLTILIAVLPLFVNRSQENKDDDKDKDSDGLTIRKKISKFRQFANFLNDIQDRLSEFKIFRAPDVVALTVISSMINFWLFFKLSTLPQEYEFHTVHHCEENLKTKKRISIDLSVSGLIPFIYFVLKLTILKIHHKTRGICCNNKIHIESEAPVIEYSKTRAFEQERLQSLEMFGAQCPIYEASIKQSLDLGQSMKSQVDAALKSE